MQHVLRCWERQSDGSEYKKTHRRPGLRPGPRWGSLQRSCKPPSWWGGLAVPSPRTPFLALGPLGLASSTPTPKLVPTPLVPPVKLSTFGERACSVSDATVWNNLPAYLRDPTLTLSTRSDDISKHTILHDINFPVTLQLSTDRDNFFNCIVLFSKWVSEKGLTSPSTHYRSFQRRVFPVNHLHWYWQPNKNNQETEHTKNTHNAKSVPS